MQKTLRPKIGLFGIGLQAYWDQFDGLEERLTGYLDVVAEKIIAHGTDLINLGLIDSVDKAFEAGDSFKREDVDLIIIHVTTYALSATVAPVLRKAKVPVVILNLSPEPNIDYKKFNAMGDRTKMTGDWLAFCSACPIPEIVNMLNRHSLKYAQITGMLHNDPSVWTEVKQWIEAVRVARTLSYQRIGLMGNYYGGMMDIYTDLTLINATFGGHMEIIEVDELSALRESVSKDETDLKIRDVHQTFEVQQDCLEDEIERAAITAVALDKIVSKYKLGAFAYYHKGSGNVANENTMSSIILGTSLLTGCNVPVAGEYEVKNVIAMKIMDTFGCGGSFTEFYAMDFADDVVLMGHDGPCHPKIAEGKIKVKPLQVYHGKVGKGLSVEMSVAHGPVTLLSVLEDGKEGIGFLIAEGESVPGEILEIGNTNSRYKFPIGAKQFVESWNNNGPAHHCAVGKGHIANKLIKLSFLLGIQYVQVC
ncbi:arabinose isomerase [Mucilaginibacter corticis]|uniref:Arabinose isomerase n=1 Tax=Mucilaginibacter corticis TaxID=2597670 RepID=A0A556MX44_9SPHI|nr:arabinose isomerase [Mucilaginibacter corticis]TSJ44452.1 arabinose isomerase [Mucilaginibacter corticis]